MASDTAPAAVPGPADPPETTPQSGPATGPLTSLLTPIQPARPTSAAFHLDPDQATPSADIATAPALPGMTSSAYHSDTPQTPDGNTSRDSGKPQTGIIRAWLLAGAERWKKGGDARNKRLDIQKARAQAHQVKEARTVNRSEKIVGGSTNSGSAAGKSLGSKAQKNAGGPKNSAPSGAKNGPSGTGGSGRAGGSGSGGASGPGGSGGRGTSGGQNGPKAGGTKSGPKTGPSKNPAGTGHGNGGSGSTEQAGGKDSNPKPPANTGPGKTPAAPTSSKAGKAGAAGKDGKDSTPVKTIPQDTTARRPWKKDKDGSAKTTKDGKAAGKTSGRAVTDSSTSTKPDKVSLDKKPKPTKQGKDGKDSSKPTKTPPGHGKTINTQPSRETGHRDGSRVATAAAHAKAYRDGFKDGWTDTTEAAHQQKQRLDQAHAQRKQQRTADQKDTNVTTTDGPQPLPVKEVTKHGVTLENGKTLRHGEVRNLKQYERRLDDKTDKMHRAADGTRQLEAHAQEQAEKAARLVELAKTVEGGDKLIGVLTKLEESSRIQASEALELHKRVVRAADNTATLKANVETRYGGIYQAVIDSGLIKPADLKWYRK